jgi:hypothetical protein
MDYLSKILGKSKYARFKANAARYSGIAPAQKGIKDIDEFPIQTAVIVPSTRNVRVRGKMESREISEKAFGNRVDLTRKQLSQFYGGYTMVKSVGGYVKTEEGKPDEYIHEKGTIVTAYANRPRYNLRKKEWLTWTRGRRRAWKQYSMGIIINNDLIYLNAKKSR